MPFARLTLVPAPSMDLVRCLQIELTSLIASVLRKHHYLTSILVESLVPFAWSIDAVARGVAAHLEVFVTVGTNTEAEKREFIRSAMATLRKAIPDLSEATYVVVHELPGTDWGYDGRPQTDRAAKMQDGDQLQRTTPQAG